MKIFIIEDEKITAARMFKLTQEVVPDAEILGPAPNISSAKDILDKHKDIDIIFSDIMLEDGLCFNLLDSVDTNAVIIFTTAYNEYAIKAFDYNCVGYILKPIQKSDIIESLNKYKKRYLLPSLSKVKEMANAIENGEKIWRKGVIINIGDSEILVSMSEVSYIESEYGNTKIFLKDGRYGFIEQSLIKLSKELDPSKFLQVSRQHIIAFDSIKSILKKSKDNPEIEIALGKVRIVCTRYSYTKLKTLIEENQLY